MGDLIVCLWEQLDAVERGSVQATWPKLTPSDYEGRLWVKEHGRWVSLFGLWPQLVRRGYRLCDRTAAP